jgi:Emfourin
MLTSTIIDTDLTSSKGAQQLRNLVVNSDFFDLPSESPRPNPGSADYIGYEITVESEGQSHTIRTNDISMPSKVSTLNF